MLLHAVVLALGIAFVLALGIADFWIVIITFIRII
jgi:hypothetical protein